MTAKRNLCRFLLLQVSVITIQFRLMQTEGQKTTLKILESYERQLNDLQERINNGKPMVNGGKLKRFKCIEEIVILNETVHDNEIWPGFLINSTQSSNLSTGNENATNIDVELENPTERLPITNSLTIRKLPLKTSSSLLLYNNTKPFNEIFLNSSHQSVKQSKTRLDYRRMAKLSSRKAPYSSSTHSRNRLKEKSISTDNLYNHYYEDDSDRYPYIKADKNRRKVQRKSKESLEEYPVNELSNKGGIYDYYDQTKNAISNYIPSTSSSERILHHRASGNGVALLSSSEDSLSRKYRILRRRYKERMRRLRAYSKPKDYSEHRYRPRYYRRKQRFRRPHHLDEEYLGEPLDSSEIHSGKRPAIMSNLKNDKPKKSEHLNEHFFDSTIQTGFSPTHEASIDTKSHSNSANSSRRSGENNSRNEIQSGNSSSSLKMTKQNCDKMTIYSKLFGVSDPRTWVRTNCHFVRSFVPAPCQDLNVFVDSCYVQKFIV